jgi:hypothetical protein
MEAILKDPRYSFCCGFATYRPKSEKSLAALLLPRPYVGIHVGDELLPGYGICEGRPNPQSILENSERALQQVPDIYIFHGQADEIIPRKWGALLHNWIRIGSNLSRYLEPVTMMSSRWLFPWVCNRR